MKNLLYCLFASLLLIACNTAVDSDAVERNSEMEVVPEMESSTVSMEGKHCFLTTLTHEPFVSDGGDTIRFVDSTVVQLEIKGEQVTGVFNWMPAEKDQAHGTLTGIINGSVVSAVYDYTIEGSNQQEEKIMEIRDDAIAIKVGELEENADGVLVLKNADEAKFSETIPRVDCK